MEAYNVSHKAVKRRASPILEGFGTRRRPSAPPVALCAACDEPLPVPTAHTGAASVGVREHRRWVQVHVGCEFRLGLELRLSL
jgi:hypothetical protein